MIFPLPEAEGAPELHPNFHFQPKRSGHPDWAQENHFVKTKKYKVNDDTEVEVEEHEENLDKNNGQTLS